MIADVRCPASRPPRALHTHRKSWSRGPQDFYHGLIEGMLTDPVYEGKSMAGLIGLIESGKIPKGSRVLYAHLGGQPALSAYAGAL